MGFDNNRNSDRPRRFNDNRDGHRQKPPGQSGRIENFEKPLIDLLKEISAKLDVLIGKDK